MTKTPVRNGTKPEQAHASSTAPRQRVEPECEELRVLLRRLLEAQEDERRLIARRLHDMVGQSMTVLKLMLDKAMRSAGKDVVSQLQEAQAVVDEVVTSVRDLSLELVPSMLDDLGLESTLLWYCRRYSARTGVKVNFRHSGLDRSLPSEISVAVFRIVQEALASVARHAGVAEAELLIRVDDHTLRLELEDRGSGFDLASVPAGGYAGLSGMKERALYLGGSLSIESSRGEGTRVAAEIPLPPKRGRSIR